jgi:diketogulonate reductase-like aldo/keto reductase
VAFQSLKQAGKIRDYGVSNIDLDDMKEALHLPGGEGIVTNQVLYNLAHRGIQWDLLPWSRVHGMPIMAYSPFHHPEANQRGLLDHPALKPIASRHDATAAQVALAWLLQQEGVVAIPKASNEAHVQENSKAFEIALTTTDLKELDQAFPPPEDKVPLEML